MKASTLYTALEFLTHWGRSYLDQVARRLRELRMIPQGGRGPHTPDIEWEHVATVLLALTGAEKAVDAAHTVLTYAPLPPIGGDAKTHGFAAAKTAIEALTAILEQYDRDGDIGLREVRINRTWPAVTIEHKDGRFWAYGNSDEKDPRKACQRPCSPDIEARLPGGFLHQLVIDLTINDPTTDSDEAV